MALHVWYLWRWHRAQPNAQRTTWSRYRRRNLDCWFCIVVSAWPTSFEVKVFHISCSSRVMLNHLKDVRAPEKATQDLFTHRMVAMWDEVHPRLTCSKLRCVFVIMIPWLQSWTNSLLIYVGYWRSVNGSSVSIGSMVRSFFAFKISGANRFQW